MVPPDAVKQSRELPPRPRRGGRQPRIQEREQDQDSDPASLRQGQRDGRKLLRSTTQTLLSLIADNLGGVYGPNQHLATLGEALVTMWAAPFEAYSDQNFTKTAYVNSRDRFYHTLEQTCKDMKLVLSPNQAPAERLQGAACTLAQAC